MRLRVGRGRLRRWRCGPAVWRRRRGLRRRPPACAFSSLFGLCMRRDRRAARARARRARGRDGAAMCARRAPRGRARAMRERERETHAHSLSLSRTRVPRDRVFCITVYHNRPRRKLFSFNSIRCHIYTTWLPDRSIARADLPPSSYVPANTQYTNTNPLALAFCQHRDAGQPSARWTPDQQRPVPPAHWRGGR